MTADVKVEIWSRSLLREADVVAMERLYREFYVGADEADFRRDLAEKDYAILLRGTGVCGFSTMKLVEVAEMRVLFSGDTVVETSQRGQWGLAGGFGHMIKFVEGMSPDETAYWLLISKGARTYRFLPTFFRRYVPGPVADADLSARLACVASALYPREYNPATGVLHFVGKKDRLRGDLLRMDTESVRFRALNPGWMNGDELCCLAPLETDNLNRLGLRVIEATAPEWHLERTQ